MKTMREVCKITGVTRRTLQEYDRIGLLSPSNKDKRKYENDAWLYSNEDIWKLIQIQVLVVSGMKRRKIKTLLNNPDFKMKDALHLAIENLVLEKARLFRLIQNLKKLYACASVDSLDSIDPALVFMTHSVKEYLGSDDLQIVRWSTDGILDSQSGRFE